MNVSNLSVNVNIALVSYVIKQLKSIYLQRSVLVVDLYQSHCNQITKLESITLVSITSVSWVRFAPGNYLLKENVIITFPSYVRIMSESYVRLTLGNYMQMGSRNHVVITFGSYVRITLQNNVRVTSKSYVRLAFGSYVIKSCKWYQKITYQLRVQVMSGLRYKNYVRMTS